VFQSPRRFASRPCMNFANAIPPRMNRHKTTNITKLFVGVGTFSGKPCTGSFGGAGHSISAQDRIGGISARHRIARALSKRNRKDREGRGVALRRLRVLPLPGEGGRSTAGAAGPSRCRQEQGRGVNFRFNAADMSDLPGRHPGTYEILLIFWTPRKAKLLTHDEARRIAPNAQSSKLLSEARSKSSAHCL
jgi:hypothetical protein